MEDLPEDGKLKVLDEQLQQEMNKMDEKARSRNASITKNSPYWAELKRQTRRLPLTPMNLKHVGCTEDKGRLCATDNPIHISFVVATRAFHVSHDWVYTARQSIVEFRVPIGLISLYNLNSYVHMLTPQNCPRSILPPFVRSQPLRLAEPRSSRKRRYVLSRSQGGYRILLVSIFTIHSELDMYMGSLTPRGTMLQREDHLNLTDSELQYEQAIGPIYSNLNPTSSFSTFEKRLAVSPLLDPNGDKAQKRCVSRAG